MTADERCVAVFRCKSELVESFLVEFYNFVKDIEGVRNLHFIIRDRVEDEVIFSFRALVDSEYKKIIESKRALASGDVVIPASDVCFFGQV